MRLSNVAGSRDGDSSLAHALLLLNECVHARARARTGGCLGTQRERNREGNVGIAIGEKRTMSDAAVA
jgi:hypothetical protein